MFPQINSSLNFPTDPLLAREAPLSRDDQAKVGEGLRGQDEALGEEALAFRPGVGLGKQGGNSIENISA